MGIYSVAILGVLLILSLSCKKENNSSGTVTDKDGNIYNTVTIGTQVWMVENLKTSRYSNGDLIGTTNPATKDITGESTPKYQWAYGGNENNVYTYGRLYTWYAVSDIRSICPIGWHVPNNDEWEILIDYLGGESLAGKKLKASDTTYWKSNGPFGWHLNEGTNESGFTALACGYRWGNGEFFGKGYYTVWWSKRTVSSERAYHSSQGYDSDDVGQYHDPKTTGNSVRCIKD